MDMTPNQVPIISPAAAGFLKDIRTLDRPPRWFVLQRLNIPLETLSAVEYELMSAGLIPWENWENNSVYHVDRDLEYEIEPQPAYAVELLDILKSSPEERWTFGRLRDSGKVSPKYEHLTIDALYELKLAGLIKLGSEADDLPITVLDSNGQPLEPSAPVPPVTVPSTATADTDRSRELFQALIRAQKLEDIDRIIQGMDAGTQRRVLTRFARAFSDIQS